MRPLIPFSVMALLAGCATTSQVGLMGLQSSGLLRVELSETVAYDYRVGIVNVMDYDFNGDLRADRERVASAALAAECTRVEVLDEQVIKLGSYLTGKPRLQYVLKLKCIRN